jgi:methionyl-tRNA formyltransferase
MKILILTDNEYIYTRFLEIIRDDKYSSIVFDFRYSPKNMRLKEKYNSDDFKSINIKKEYLNIIENYDLIISLHSKQIFPKKLVESVRCINIHPGYNPYNRGWYPQVFSILNKLPIGVTIHEMDEFLDHGPIIFRKELITYPWETSSDVYARITEEEIAILKEKLLDIINSSYQTFYPEKEGNINSKEDFNSLCEIDMSKVVSMEQAIDYLRAMTFPGYKNAYFYKDGRKVYIELKLTQE